VFTLRAGVMESSDKMVALKNLLGFDPFDDSQNSTDVTVFDKILAALESMDLGAWQLSNSVHLGLSQLVTSKLISLKETSIVHSLFLHQT
jgi:hypothetical protein